LQILLLQFTVAAQVCHGKCLSHFGRCKCVMHFTVEGREEGRGMRNSHGRSRLGRAAACSALPHTASRRENKAAGGAGRAGGERRWGRNNNPSTAICYHCQHIFFGSERQVLEGWGRWSCHLIVLWHWEYSGSERIRSSSESDPRANANPSKNGREARPGPRWRRRQWRRSPHRPRPVYRDAAGSLPPA